MRHCVEVVMASVNQRMSKTSDRVKEAYSPIYQENLGTYIRWLLFLSRETTWIYADHGAETAAKFGPSFCGEALEQMYSNGTEDLQAFMRRSPPMIDLVLYLWRWKSATGNPMYIQYDVKGQSCPLISLISFFLLDGKSVEVLRQKVDSFTYRGHRALIEGSLARLRLWKASRAKSDSLPPVSDPINIVNLTQIFLPIPHFSKAFVKSKFPFHAFSALKAFTDLRVTSAPSREVTPLPVAIGTSLLLADPGFRPAFLIQNVFSQLLDADLLQTIVDDMLSEQEGSNYPFRRWRQTQEWPFGPLDILRASGVDKAICDAVVRGLSRLSQDQTQSLKKSHLAANWFLFRMCFRANEYAWDEAAKTLPVVCDNLNVSSLRLPFNVLLLFLTSVKIAPQPGFRTTFALIEVLTLLRGGVLLVAMSARGLDCIPQNRVSAGSHLPHWYAPLRPFASHSTHVLLRPSNCDLLGIAQQTAVLPVPSPPLCHELRNRQPSRVRI